MSFHRCSKTVPVLAVPRAGPVAGVGSESPSSRRSSDGGAAGGGGGGETAGSGCLLQSAVAVYELTVLMEAGEPVARGAAAAADNAHLLLPDSAAAAAVASAAKGGLPPNPEAVREHLSSTCRCLRILIDRSLPYFAWCHMTIKYIEVCTFSATVPKNSVSTGAEPVVSDGAGE